MFQGATTNIFALDQRIAHSWRRLSLANLPIPATQALITPDGKLLAVAAGKVYLFNTSSNSEVVSGGISQGTGITTISIAAEP